MGPTELALLISLVPLMGLSAFFSASETTLFGLGEAQRQALRRGSSSTGRAVEGLLATPRQLLITILLGNMVVNVCYFVISSVLLTQSTLGLTGDVTLGVGSVLGLIVLGEVLPKMVANARRMQLIRLVAPVLLVVHRILGPARVVLDRLIVAPLSRLTAPTAAPPELNSGELSALLDASGREGVIDLQEQRLLRDVMDLGRLRVRDVMTPRVRMIAVPRNASREQVIALTRRHRLTRLPVYDGDLDHIIGELHVKRLLLKPAASRTAFVEATSKPRFVPDMISLEHLLAHFRATKSQSAIVVDEYGGTAGVVAIEDVVEQLVGDIDLSGAEKPQHPIMVGMNTWRVGGDVSIHDWAEAFGQDLVSPRVATLGGLIIERLGRAPQVGDVVELGNVSIKVEQVDRSCVVSATVTLNLGDDRPPEAST